MLQTINPHNDDGFSLLELVTAVGILLILSVVGVSSYKAIQNNSRQSAINKAADEVYDKAFSTLVDGDASTNPSQVQDEYNNSSQNVKVSVEELGNDRISVKAFFEGDEESDATVVKTTPAVEGSEDTGTNPPGNGGEETTPPVIGNTFSTAIMKCDKDTIVVGMPFTGFDKNTQVTVQEIGKSETFKILEVESVYDLYRDIVGGTESQFEHFVKTYSWMFGYVENVNKESLGYAPKSFTYKAGVEYELKIDGPFNAFVGRSTSCVKKVDLSNNSGVSAVSFGSGIEDVQPELPSSVRNLVAAFYQSDINDPDIANWDVSNVETMNSIFTDASSFNQDLSGWDVSNVEDMESMFSGASAFNNGGKALLWGDKTKNVKSMRAMFQNATSFNQDISNWNVSNVEQMDSMFNNATSFNQNLSSWNVPRITTPPYNFSKNAPIKGLPQWGKS